MLRFLRRLLKRGKAVRVYHFKASEWVYFITAGTLYRAPAVSYDADHFYAASPESAVEQTGFFTAGLASPEWQEIDPDSVPEGEEANQ